GSTWSSVPSDAWLWAVLAYSPTEAWAVGYPNTILHWNGNAWVTVASPFSDSGEFLRGVWGTGPCDVWVTATYAGAAHYDCTSWTVTPKSPGLASGGALWGTGMNDIWSAGAWDGMAHWNGSVWSFFPIGAHEETMHVRGFNSNDVWAT